MEELIEEGRRRELATCIQSGQMPLNNDIFVNCTDMQISNNDVLSCNNTPPENNTCEENISSSSSSTNKETIGNNQSKKPTKKRKNKKVKEGKSSEPRLYSCGTTTQFAMEREYNVTFGENYLNEVKTNKKSSSSDSKSKGSSSNNNKPLKFSRIRFDI